MAKLKQTSALYPHVGDIPGVITARETRDGDSWLAVEFPGYGWVCLPEDQFEVNE